jgi:polar amino acid transport system substrate-binding protein
MPPKAFLVVLGLVIAVGATSGAAAGQNQGLDRIIEAGTVRIAVPDNFRPFGDRDRDGKLQGYDIDTAALVADALGVKLDLIPVPSGDRVRVLGEGKVDLVISSLGKTAEREQAIDFSIAYAPFFSGIFGPTLISVTRSEDLAGKTIAVTRGTVEDKSLTKIAPPGATIERFDDNIDTEIAYFSWRTELIATGNAFAAEVLRDSVMKKTTMKVLLENSPSYIGVKKDEPDLLARINAIVAAARKDGNLNRISERWLKARLGDPEHPEWIAIQ